jgi:glycosyltransferase involved in cell wall biosynthesis
MLVTVVVPLYRGKKYIEPKIRMFEKAFIKADIVDKAEVLFINDYPDEIIELPESQISVRLLSNEKNQGIQRTRIRGILESNATYIHMLDQDDEIKEDFYLENLKFAPGNDVVV